MAERTQATPQQAQQQKTQQMMEASKRPTSQLITVADTICQQLAAWGVRRIYGVAGDTFLDLLDAIDRSPLQFIAVKHESTAAFMASAEAKLTGGLGVCLATSGPGMANLLNGLGDAYQDKASVLAITGQVPTKQIGTDTKQYLDQQVFIEPLAAYSALLADPAATVDVFAKAIHTALEAGAVTHVSVPKDLFSMQQTTAIRQKPTFLRGTVQLSAEDVQQAVRLLQTAQRPMVVAGLGARPVAPQVVQLCEAWGAGLILSLGAKGMVEETCPHLLGGIGKAGSPYASEALKQADVVLLIGDNWWPQGYVPANTSIVQVDVQASNIGTRFPVELGLVGKAETVVPALLAEMGKGQQPQQATDRRQWLDTIKQARETWYAEIEREATTEGTPIHPARLMRGLEQVVADDAVICVDTGDHTVWFNRIFRGKRQDVVFSGTWRTMGFGLPAAMACQLTSPDRQVVAVVGDGGLGMTLADLSTAVRYNLPITIVVVNNGHLQMETDRQRISHHSELGSDLTNPDFVKIAEACGLAGFRVTTSQELDQILQQALSLPGPTLVDVVTQSVLFPNTSPNEG